MSFVHHLCGNILHRFLVFNSSKRCGWSCTRLHHYNQNLCVSFLTTFLISVPYIYLHQVVWQESRGNRDRGITGALHSSDHRVMAILAQTCAVHVLQWWQSMSIQKQQCFPQSEKWMRTGALNIACSQSQLGSQLQQSGYRVLQSDKKKCKKIGLCLLECTPRQWLGTRTKKQH